MQELARKLSRAHKVVRKGNVIGRKKSKKYYDRNTKLQKFYPGDLVYLLDPIAKRRVARKFAAKWQGPYLVVERRSQLTYKILNDNGRELVVHVNRLKPCKIKYPQAIGKDKIREPNTETQPEVRRRTRTQQRQASIVDVEANIDEVNRPYNLRTRPMKSNEQVIQEILQEELGSDSASESSFDIGDNETANDAEGDEAEEVNNATVNEIPEVAQEISSESSSCNNDRNALHQARSPYQLRSRSQNS